MIVEMEVIVTDLGYILKEIELTRQEWNGYKEQYGSENDSRGTAISWAGEER